jgi:hypothetical protein
MDIGALHRRTLVQLEDHSAAVPHNLAAIVGAYVRGA